MILITNKQEHKEPKLLLMLKLVQKLLVLKKQNFLWELHLVKNKQEHRMLKLPYRQVLMIIKEDLMDMMVISKN